MRPWASPFLSLCLSVPQQLSLSCRVPEKGTLCPVPSAPAACSAWQAVGAEKPRDRARRGAGRSGAEHGLEEAAGSPGGTGAPPRAGCSLGLRKLPAGRGGRLERLAPGGTLQAGGGVGSWRPGWVRAEAASSRDFAGGGRSQAGAEGGGGTGQCGHLGQERLGRLTSMCSPAEAEGRDLGGVCPDRLLRGL